MKTLQPSGKTEQLLTLLYVLFICFWLFACSSKLADFNGFKDELYSQVFTASISGLLLYLLPAVEFLIACLLVSSATRLAGLILSFSLMSAYSIYVLLAVLNVYSRTPCNCAGLLGLGSSWTANLLLNLFITTAAAITILFTYKAKERRKKGMDTPVSPAPLTAY